jgi:hypothetical protein
MAMTLLAALPSAAAASEPSWSPQPWIEDLDAFRDAMATKYANREWLTKDRGFNLDRTFDRGADRLRTAGSDAEARALFDRLLLRIADGHLAIRWPAAGAGPAPATAGDNAPPRVADACKAMGYDATRSAPGLAKRLPGYRALDGDDLASGIVPVGGDRLGVIRIGEFDPHMAPSLCADAARALKLEPTKPCDDWCQGEILTGTYARLTGLLEERVRALRASGANVLMIDLTGNGGGSEWAEAAARIVSPVPLTSARIGFVRGDHWAHHWQDLAAKLRDFAAETRGKERARLLAWAAEADAYRLQAADACVTSGSCALVANGPFATGLVGTAAAGDLSGKAWSPYVFSIAQFPYHDSVWTGPLLVLVDDETWSAAEEFAAMLQDNEAAVIVGSRTGGAGCGHTDGGTPVTLPNSKAVLELPDCVRFRVDGSNEVNGVIPDVLTGLRYRDGAERKSALVAAHLPEAIARAKAQRVSPD